MGLNTIEGLVHGKCANVSQTHTQIYRIFHQSVSIQRIVNHA